jgi:hypothetical protein
MKRLLVALLLSLPSWSETLHKAEPLPVRDECLGDFRRWARVQADSSPELEDWGFGGDRVAFPEARESDHCESADDLEPDSRGGRLEVQQAFRELDPWALRRESQENNRFWMPRLIPPVDLTAP